MTGASFFGVAGGGASHISTSLELSESSNEMASFDLHWFCWTELSCGTSLAGTALLSDLSPEDVPSPRSHCVDSARTAFLDVSTVGLPEKEVVGVSASLGDSRGASTVDRFVSGCSGAGVLAFLFPRSRLVSVGLLSTESKVLCSLLLDVPLKRIQTNKTWSEGRLISHFFLRKYFTKTPASCVLSS